MSVLITASTMSPPARTPGRPARAGLRHLLGIEGLSRAQIEALLDEARRMKERLLRLRAGARPETVFGGPPPLAGRRVFTLFYENSTRTMQSFHAAATLLGAVAGDLPVARSSVLKGERLDDTLATLRALGADAVVLRHPATGAAAYAARHLDIPVINAGDGTGEHPTQALLDALTILERKGRVAGLKVAIVGDVRHSRVARSNVRLLSALGAEVWLAGPATALPPRDAFPGVRVTTDTHAALAGADVVMALRIQRERQADGLLPETGEYRRRWGLDAVALLACKRDVLIMHPGPVNRGVELDGELLADPRCAVQEQVTNGVAARMAVLRLLLAGEEGSAWAAS